MVAPPAVAPPVPVLVAAVPYAIENYGNSTWVNSVGGTAETGQTFLVPMTARLEKYMVKAWQDFRTGPTNAQARVFATAAGRVTGPPLATSDTLPIPVPMTDTEFTFAVPPTLTAGATYAVVVAPTTPGDSMMMVMSNFNPYADGTLLFDTAGLNLISAGMDVYFKASFIP